MKDLTGQKFGRLTVIKRDGSDNFRLAMWLCKCDCGNFKRVRSRALQIGQTQSCGCLHKEITAITHTKHGGRHTRLYNIWCGIKARCLNEQTACFKYYGGRGIKICDEWTNFKPFYEWSMANGYDDKLTIDRIDVNGNYEPNNCRWVTLKEQQNNRTNNHLITLGEKTCTLKEWADSLGISHSTLLERIERWGNIEEALTIPKGGKQKWR